MQANNLVDPGLLAILRCPVSGKRLKTEGDGLATIDGSHRYAVVAGIPCLIPENAEPTHVGFSGLQAVNRRQQDDPPGYDDSAVARFIDAMIVSTCGNLYAGTHFVGQYPIPEFPTEFSSGSVLEVGCNWGRWTIAGALAGCDMIGIDVHLEALMCAQALSRKLVPHRQPHFVLADARTLPFDAGTFAGVFSYSVLQHFSRENMTVILDEIRRVLVHGGRSLIQMPNRAGLRSLVVLARRGFSKGSEFDVRYYSVDELLQLFSRHVGESDWRVDCFMGLNVHGYERPFVAPSRRWIVDVAELLLRASEKWPLLRRYGDSVFVSSIKI